MTNRPDLIAKLKALNPTEGEWWANPSEGIFVNTRHLYADIHSSDDDDKLITLAPTMRLEILDMTKEIEELREEIDKLKPKRIGVIGKTIGVANNIQVQIATACGRFELDTLITSALMCKNCGKGKFFHVTPQPK
jgi:hypothetical protein